MTDALPAYDSFLLVSFGGPEGPQDVIPFLENVLRGKNVPRERMLEVAEHYQHFGGVSPINEQNRQLLQAVEAEFRSSGIDLPVYWGNRNWHPLLTETLEQMKRDGRKRAIAFFTSMFSCYSGCRQYRENIAEAQQSVGDGVPLVEKVRMGFNHPGFIEAMSDSLRSAMDSLCRDPDSLRDPGSIQGSVTSPNGSMTNALVLFTAHSIPTGMSDNCDYVKQLNESCRLVAEACLVSDWRLVFQSRSGPPQQPWLEPDVCDVIRELASSHSARQVVPRPVVVVPIGFISDHMEVMFDLDEQAAGVCAELGIPFARASTAGRHPKFVQMIRELVQERLQGSERRAMGMLGPWHDVCPQNCCLYTPRRPAEVVRPA